MDNKSIEGRCKTCKHWKQNGGYALALCALSKYRLPQMRSGCGLYTQGDFGCILFEEVKK